MSKSHPFTLGVIVAGGRGARLGLGRPKAFAEVGGMTLLARAEAVLAALCDAIVIAAPASLELPPHRFPRVADATDAAVPLAGLVAGLAKLPFARAVALGVDFPLMRPEAFAALRKHDPHAHACWVYDLDALEARARRFRAAVAPLTPLAALALKSNALPALLERARAAGLGAEAGSLGELEMARAAGFLAKDCVLNGNGRTREEAEWAAREGVHSVNADSIDELDLLDRPAADAGR